MTVKLTDLQKAALIAIAEKGVNDAFTGAQLAETLVTTRQRVAGVMGSFYKRGFAVKGVGNATLTEEGIQVAKSLMEQPQVAE